jgi:hypothetical protein
MEIFDDDDEKEELNTFLPIDSIPPEQPFVKVDYVNIPLLVCTFPYEELK